MTGTERVHCYTRLGPHEGAETIGGFAALGVATIDAQWYVENAIEQGDQVVIEWAMTWRDPNSGGKRLDRGTEWSQIRDGKIAEGRGYRRAPAESGEGAV
ncbi:MAG TPA: nuclear transport factor 2 family protein [Solirubrobacterales bacterium]|nr:nuclear transport factor 2 family protein [Solirubrobacterales bacterium]